MPLVPAVEPRPEDRPPRNDELVLRDLGFRTHSVYGDDDRIDVRQGTTDALELAASKNGVEPHAAKAWAEQVLAVSRAVALLVEAESLQTLPDGSLRLESITYNALVLKREGVPLCDDPRARFRDQPTAGLCTAWLAEPTLMVTAQHCVGARRAEEMAFVFGWQQLKEGGFPGAPAVLQPAQVFRGRAIRARGTGADGNDYAVIELDRPVPADSGIAPLTMRRSGRPRIGEPVYLLGCPRGLPLKFAGGARVHYVHRMLPLLRADVDAFHGNSGSPVLSGQDHRVVGILVRGKSDFFVLEDPRCAIEARTDIRSGGETILGCVAFHVHIPRTTTDTR